MSLSHMLDQKSTNEKPLFSAVCEQFYDVILLPAADIIVQRSKA